MQTTSTRLAYNIPNTILVFVKPVLPKLLMRRTTFGAMWFPPFMRRVTSIISKIPCYNFHAQH